MKRVHAGTAAIVAAAALVTGCADTPSTPDPAAEPQAARSSSGLPDGPYHLSPPAFDIAAAPDGSILVAENTTVKEIRRDGTVSDVIEVPTTPGSALNGLAAVGRRSLFATSAGQDLAVGAGVWHVSSGRARLVGDIEGFEAANDPDAFEGPQWKDPRCEALAGFSAGPQSNPYHLTGLQGGAALVADAAGNTLLIVRQNEGVDWVALFTPPVDDDGDWLVLGSLGDGTPCYTQPVPTSVAVGPDGAYYVGELTGLTAAELGGAVAGAFSRVWRVEPGARHAVCPSDDCRTVLSGLTSIIDLAFGPDGRLYVTEYDENGWFTAVVLGSPAGGTVSRCDVGSGTCTPLAEGLSLPSALAFDKWGDLWLLEGNITAPEVRRLAMP